MHVIERDDIKDHSEVFFGFSALCLAAAVSIWHSHTTGGWGNWIQWLGRGIDTIACVVFIGIMHWKGKTQGWSRKTTILVPILLLSLLWAMFAISSIALSYIIFLILFAVFFAYALLLGICFLYDLQRTKLGDALCALGFYMGPSKWLVWAALLFVGVLEAWVNVAKVVKGSISFVLLILFFSVAIILIVGNRQNLAKNR